MLGVWSGTRGQVDGGSQVEATVARHTAFVVTQVIGDLDRRESAHARIPHCLSNPCKDGICLALIYDNDSTEEPDIPPYVDPDASTSKEESIVNSSENVPKKSCPTNSMPGAFKDW
jgi:hypothetical protein